MEIALLSAERSKDPNRQVIIFFSLVNHSREFD